MLSEIGSNFWLNPNQRFKECPLGTPDRFNCKGSDYIWLSTGRSAISYVIKTIEERKPGIRKVAVLPSFTCDTVIEPFFKRGFRVYYYPISKDLTTTSDAILRTVLMHDASIVLFHRYFGFDTLDGHVDRMCDILRGLEKFSIEDCTQCLYSAISRAASDFTVGSIRKWTGTPDGGFAVCRSGFFNEKPNEPDYFLEALKVKASYAKYRFLFEKKGDKSEMLALYRDAEVFLDQQNEYYAISPMSVKVQANLDVEGLVYKRRNNYGVLKESLEGLILPLFCLDGNQAVPLYFPVLVEDRAALQSHLAQNTIYAPIVWPKDEQQPAQCDGAENAYDHLLCIPIDQRYESDDMNRIAEIIRIFFT